MKTITLTLVLLAVTTLTASAQKTIQIPTHEEVQRQIETLPPGIYEGMSVIEAGYILASEEAKVEMAELAFYRTYHDYLREYRQLREWIAKAKQSKSKAWDKLIVHQYYTVLELSAQRHERAAEVALGMLRIGNIFETLGRSIHSTVSKNWAEYTEPSYRAWYTQASKATGIGLQDPDGIKAIMRAAVGHMPPGKVRSYHLADYR